MNTNRVAARGLGRAIAVGAVAGVIASLVMAMYAMGAAWERDTGFFTPLYHIASLWAPGDEMMASMESAMGGEDFHFAFGTALLGAVIHMMTGAVFGAVFGLLVGLLASRIPVGVAVIAGIGLVWGAVVFAFSAYVGLPAAAAVFDSGDPTSDMAEMAGWGTFFVEHLIYGIVLGALVGLGLRRARTDAPMSAGAR